MSNEEFSDFVKDRSLFLSSIAKSRYRKDPNGNVTTDGLRLVSAMCRGSGHFGDQEWIDTLYTLTKSGKLDSVLKGKTSRKDRILSTQRLKAQNKLKYAINDLVVLKENGKHGQVVDYEPESKTYLVVFNPFEFEKCKDSDLLSS